MYSNNKYKGIDPIIVSIVSKKSQQLIKHQCFSESDLEDLQQELLIDVIIKLAKYDPQKSPLPAYVKIIVSNKARDIIKRTLSEKRLTETLQYSSYNMFDDDNQEITLIENISEELNLLSSDLLPLMQQTEVRYDIQRVMDTLPDDLKEIYQLLQEYSVTEIAAITGFSRKTIYKNIKTIRTILANFELNEYL